MNADILVRILIVGTVVIYGGWLFYMKTFRTQDWLRMQELEKAKQDQRMKVAGTVLKTSARTGFWLARRFMK
jgi:hypothetical protein